MEIIIPTETIVEYLSISSVLLLILGLLSFLSIRSLKIQGKAKLCICTLVVVLPLVYPLKTLFPESLKIPVRLELNYLQLHNSTAEKTISTIEPFISNNPEAPAGNRLNEKEFIEKEVSTPGLKDRFMTIMSGLIRNWKLAAAIIWVVIFSFFLARVIAAGYKTNRLLRLADPVTNPEILKLLQKSVSETGLRYTPRFLMVEGISTPMVMGFLNPAIVIPRHLLSLEFREGLRFALLHELKHLQQHHNWWLLIESIIGAAYFFHPVFHWAKRKIHEELEYICDNHVIHITNKSVSYADFLLNQIWQHNSGRNPALTLPFVSVVSKTTTRIHSILENARPTPFMHMRDRITVLFILMVFPSILLLSISPPVPLQDKTFDLQNPMNIDMQADATSKREPAGQEKEISFSEKSLTSTFDEESSPIEKTVQASKTQVNIGEPDKLIRAEKISIPVQDKKSQSVEMADEEHKSEIVKEDPARDVITALNVLGLVVGNNMLWTQSASDTKDMTDKSISQVTLAEKYLGAPVNELTISRIDNINILDQYTILFIMRGGDMYITRLSEPCPGLLHVSDFGYDSMNGGRISKFSRIHAISHGQIVGTSGMFSGFYPYLYEGNKYEAIKALKKDLLAVLVTEGAFKEFVTAEG